MQTNFSIYQLGDPAIAHSEAILRKCVHCGFCTATCPTYQILGDELDSPRGRIYLIKDMLENSRHADEKTVKHVDRCLSCLSCMTTCPSGVHYMHLVDHARAHIEKTYKRPVVERIYRNLLATILPYPRRFRFALKLAKLAKPFIGLLGRIPAMGPMAAMLKLAPSTLASPAKLKVQPMKSGMNSSHKRVAILSGCAQSVLDPQINSATVELLTRFGVEIVKFANETCCGSLVHHMGREDAAHKFAIQNIIGWMREIENKADGRDLDAIIITASGCGTTVKDYGHMLRNSKTHAQSAEKIASLTKDITEFLHELQLPKIENETKTNIAYHAACSLQHGQKVTDIPRALLKNAGFSIREIPQGHLCCGSAGTYNIMQAEIAEELKMRKIGNIEKIKPDLIATGNIGCMTQLATATHIPVLHTVEILNWAYGGTVPSKLKGFIARSV